MASTSDKKAEQIAYEKEVGLRIKDIRKSREDLKLNTLNGASLSKKNKYQLSRMTLNRAELGTGLTAYNIRAIAELYGVSSDEIIFNTIPEYARITQRTGLNKEAIENLVKLKNDNPELRSILEAFLLDQELLIKLLEVLNVYMYIDLDRMVPRDYAFTSMLDNDAQVLNALMVDSVQEVLTTLRDKYREKRIALLDEQVRSILNSHFQKMRDLKRENALNRVHNMEDDFGVTISVTPDVE